MGEIINNLYDRHDPFPGERLENKMGQGILERIGKETKGYWKDAWTQDQISLLSDGLERNTSIVNDTR